MATDNTIISYLRSKVADNPTYEVENEIVPNLTEQVWSDGELLSELNSSMIRLFKGHKTSLTRLSDIEIEYVVLETRAELMHQLGIDATKYRKYSMQDTTVEKTSPQEYLTIAESLRKYLDKILEDGGNEVADVGATVSEGVIVRYDRQRDYYIPNKFAEAPPNIPFYLSITSEGVLISTQKIFFANYREHYIKRTNSLGKEIIIGHYYDLSERNILDDTVQEGQTYVYTLYVENLNDKINSEAKSITFTTS